MTNLKDFKTQALFLSPDGTVYPDALICSGMLPAELKGKPCPFSHRSRIPSVRPLDIHEPNYSIDKGKPGDLCPPCTQQQLSSLAHWQGHAKGFYPEELLPLRLFKCRQGFWFVVLGLRDDEPTHLLSNES